MKTVLPLHTLVCLLLVSPAIARAAEEGAPAFLGIARRADVPATDLQAIEGSLTRALSDRGIANLSGRAVVVERKPLVSALRASLKEAQKKLGSDLSGSKQALDDALEDFEGELAFNDDAGAWDIYRDLMALRVVVLARQKNENGADDALLQLLAVDPGYTPGRKAGPELTKRYKKLAERAKKSGKVALEITSDPPGADVVVDGRSVGVTPYTMTDTRPGIHFVAISLVGERSTQKVIVGKGRARATAKLLSTESRDFVREAMRGLSEPRLPNDVDNTIAKVAPDAFFAVAVRRGDDVDVLLAHQVKGKLVSVVGARAGHTPEENNKAAALLADAASENKEDGWLDVPSGRRAGGPREVLIGAEVAPATTAKIEEDGGNPWPWIIGGTVAGIVVVGAAGAGVGYYFFSLEEGKKAFTWRIDAAGLQ